MDQRRIIFLVGPTGVGKTEISFHLARRLNAQIVSCDAMQVYREVSILSGKPSEAALEKIPHHLIGMVSIKEEFDVMNFRKIITEENRTSGYLLCFWVPLGSAWRGLSKAY